MVSGWLIDKRLRSRSPLSCEVEMAAVLEVEGNTSSVEGDAAGKLPESTVPMGA